MERLRVSQQPAFMVISTGNELVEPGDPIEPWQLRRSNAYGLMAALRRRGFLRVADDHLVIAAGDVCGKGIPAALFMAVTVTLLRTLARQRLEPREILARLNDELAAQNPRGMFVTLTCLDVRGGTVTCANAGHDTALLVEASGAQRAVFASSGRAAPPGGRRRCAASPATRRCRSPCTARR